VEFFGSCGKAAVADDFQKGASEIDVHGAAGAGGAGIVRALPTGGE
jgi:hypothetical protein